MNIKNSKETILNQALAIFGRLGFHKTTMADIANASKRGRRTIYTYFKNKEEVYEAVVEREIDKVLEDIQENIANTDLAQNQLSIYIGSRLSSIIELTKNYDALRVAYLNNYQWVEKIRTKLDAQEHKLLKEILTKGIDQNVFTIIDLSNTITSLTYIIRGVEFILIKENDTIITNQQIEGLQTTILNGLLSR